MHLLAVDVAKINGISPSNAQFALRIGLAAALGGLVGLEREIRDRQAGLRTHISVSLGACLFGLISAYGYDAFVTHGAVNYQFDPSRVAAQIVVGVGFLGGGAILHDGNRVRGLTTAASLWVCAAIGLGASLGAYFMTLFTTLVLLVVLVVLRGPRLWLRARYSETHDVVVIHLKTGANPSAVLAAIGSLQDIQVRSMHMREGDEAPIIAVRLRGEPGTNTADAVQPLFAVDGVQSVNID